MLVTDDFSMAAAYEAPGGLAAASVAALNAGVDLILTSYDPDQYFPMVYALLRAEAAGSLKKQALEQSDRRLSGATFEQAPQFTRASCHLAGNSC